MEKLTVHGRFMHVQVSDTGKKISIIIKSFVSQHILLNIAYSGFYFDLISL